MLGILATVEAAVKIGLDVAPLLTKLAETFKKGGAPATQDMIDECRAIEAALSAQIQAPLPDELP